ncbi:hypothetical protein EV639_10941 [Rathayibacter tanaceti]|uniref:ABC-2 family transporter protein n=2 Tax=Rathayibacter tanaceti TaxID=1671680 RepID=A0AAE6RH26_9MICO|nr:hypothetical protein [Rathayibacter tanaceti]QHC54474.1 hypothetical protein GSU10_01550 [Rathayibacter tanaceti]TCO35037.1 hypothetical protein EV639_10941 [Rathayibacter tanaceti]
MSTTEPRPSTRTAGIDLTMPENHLDVVATPGSVDPSRTASLRTRLIAVISMPLFFLVAFSLAYVSAGHAPVPHDLAITLSGPAQVTDQLADALEERAEGAFDASRADSAEQARQAVADRDAVGAVIVDGSTVTTVIASGGGRLAAAVVQQVGDQAAAQLGTTATIEDVAPLPADDPGGSVLFFFLVICTVGAFLSITAISQAIPRAGVKALLATAAGAALLVPVLGFSMISLFVDFGVDFGQVAAVIGVGMLYSFTVGVIATLLTLLLGQGAVLAEILILVALNFPSAGASTPESMLPPFWQVVHNGWLGSGGFEAMRGILFFDGAGIGRWLLQLGIWTVSALVLTVLVARRRKREGAVEVPAAASAVAG